MFTFGWQNHLNEKEENTDLLQYGLLSAVIKHIPFKGSVLIIEYDHAYLADAKLITITTEKVSSHCYYNNRWQQYLLSRDYFIVAVY